jgi:hypothetical protein
VRDQRAFWELARRHMQRWRALAPEDRLYVREYMCYAATIGQPELALPLLRDFPAGDRRQDWALPLLAEALFQLERPAEYVAVADSVLSAAEAARARGDTARARTLWWPVSWLQRLAGRPTVLRPHSEFTRPPLPFRTHYDLLSWGLAPETLTVFERDLVHEIPLERRNVGPDGTPNAQAQAYIRQTLLYLSMTGFHERRVVLTHDTLSWNLPWRTPWLHRFQLRLVAGDSAGARALLSRMDYQLYLGDPTAATLRDDHLWVAESYLQLGDSAAALERMRDFARKLPRSAFGFAMWDWLPRFWLRYGDLAYAMRQRDEAVRGYRFIASLWANADPFLQPTVQRVRARLAELTAARN